MKTNNRFADYLLNSDRMELYPMLDNDNWHAFLDFFRCLVTVAEDDDQFALAIISSSYYRWDKGKYIPLPCKQTMDQASNMRNGLYTPGDLIALDYYSDESMYSPGFQWCLPRTKDIIGDFTVKVELPQSTCLFKLHLFDSGFVKYFHRWEITGPLLADRIYTPLDLE